MEPPPTANIDDDDADADLGLGLGSNHNDDSLYEPLPPHNHRGSYHHPASHLHHRYQQQQQLQQHQHHGGGGGGGHPEQQQQHHHHPLITQPQPHHYSYPNYNNYAHHHHPHHHHHHAAAAAAAAMNYQTYATAAATTYPPPPPPTQYHHPAAPSITTYQYDAPPRPGAAAATTTAAATAAAAAAYPQYSLQEQQNTLKQPEYLHQHYHQRYHPPPHPPTQHEVPPPPLPPPAAATTAAGYAMDQQQQQQVKEMEQQQQQQLRQRQQQQQQQVEEVVVAPSPVLKKMQELVDEVVKQPDSTTALDQPKQLTALDSTPNELMVAEVDEKEEKDLHEEKVASDDSPNAAATVTATDDVVVDASRGAESHEAEELNEEIMADVEDENSCEVLGKTPLPIPTNDVATIPTTLASEANIKEKDEDTTPLLTSCSTQSTTTEKVFPFDTILNSLQHYETKYQSLFIPTSHPTFIEIVSNLVQNGIEEEAYALWERNFALLQEYKERVGDCDVPFTAKPLGSWVVHQRVLYSKHHQQQEQPQQQKQLPPQTPTEIRKLHTSRFERLTQLGFDFSTPMWDVRLQELITYKTIHDHCSPPVSYPKLGIWVVNQRFNIKDMSKERVEALDSLGFVWNHNRKNRSQDKWDGRYEELCEYQKQNGHCNVPATFRHSTLGSWVGKQREEYKKLKDKKSSQLDKYRIDKLNEIGFQWSLLNWTTVSWEDRFEALKAYKEQHGHVKIPRNHPDFGNWPIYQKSQYKLFKEGKKSKLTKEKVDKLIQIGFLESNETPSLSAQATAALVTQKGGDYDAGYEWYPSM